MVTETDLDLSDGRTLHIYDADAGEHAGRGRAPRDGQSGG
jgi:hypothetical protein